MEPKTLFLLACIPTRLGVAWLASRDAFRPVLQYALFAVGLSFAWLYFSNSRLTAREAGGVTWWASWRWVHAAMYLAAALLLMLERPWLAGRVLVADALLGLLLHVTRYY